MSNKMNIEDLKKELADVRLKRVNDLDFTVNDKAESIERLEKLIARQLATNQERPFRIGLIYPERFNNFELVLNKVKSFARNKSKIQLHVPHTFICAESIDRQNYFKSVQYPTDRRWFFLCEQILTYSDAIIFVNRSKSRVVSDLFTANECSLNNKIPCREIEIEQTSKTG